MNSSSSLSNFFPLPPPNSQTLESLSQYCNKTNSATNPNPLICSGHLDGISGSHAVLQPHPNHQTSISALPLLSYNPITPSGISVTKGLCSLKSRYVFTDIEIAESILDYHKDQSLLAAFEKHRENTTLDPLLENVELPQIESLPNGCIAFEITLGNDKCFDHFSYADSMQLIRLQTSVGVVSRGFRTPQYRLRLTAKSIKDVERAIDFTEKMKQKPLGVRIEVPFKNYNISNDNNLLQDFDWDLKLRGEDNANLTFIASKCNVGLLLCIDQTCTKPSELPNSSSSSQKTPTLSFIFLIYAYSQQARGKAVCFVCDLIKSVIARWDQYLTSKCGNLATSIRDKEEEEMERNNNKKKRLHEDSDQNISDDEDYDEASKKKFENPYVRFNKMCSLSSSSKYTPPPPTTTLWRPPQLNEHQQFPSFETIMKSLEKSYDANNINNNGCGFKSTSSTSKRPRTNSGNASYYH